MISPGECVERGKNKEDSVALQRYFLGVYVFCVIANEYVQRYGNREYANDAPKTWKRWGVVRDPGYGGPSWPMYTHPAGYSPRHPRIQLPQPALEGAGGRGGDSDRRRGVGGSGLWDQSSGAARSRRAPAHLPRLLAAWVWVWAWPGREWAWRGRGARPCDGAQVLSWVEQPSARAGVSPRLSARSAAQRSRFFARASAPPRLRVSASPAFCLSVRVRLPAPASQHHEPGRARSAVQLRVR